MSFALLAPCFAASADAAQPASSIHSATLAESGASTPEVSTEELRRLLVDGSTVLLDTRPHMEWAISHIPGALNVAPKPGTSMALYTSDVAHVGRLVEQRKNAPLVLYCNGPFCGKSKRLSEELLAAGYRNVRRYQLGAPVWRALGGVMVTAPEGARYVYAHDRTAVWIDAREPAEFAAGTLEGARNIPQSALGSHEDSGELARAKEDGRLPMEDHNTRIIVFGESAEQARAVADAIAREAFHNISYFEGSADQLRATVSAAAAGASE